MTSTLQIHLQAGYETSTDVVGTAHTSTSLIKYKHAGWLAHIESGQSDGSEGAQNSQHSEGAQDNRHKLLVVAEGCAPVAAEHKGLINQVAPLQATCTCTCTIHTINFWYTYIYTDRNLTLHNCEHAFSAILQQLIDSCTVQICLLPPPPLQPPLQPPNPHPPNLMCQTWGKESATQDHTPLPSTIQDWISVIPQTVKSSII